MDTAGLELHILSLRHVVEVKRKRGDFDNALLAECYAEHLAAFIQERKQTEAQARDVDGWQEIDTAPKEEGGVAFLTDGLSTTAAFWGYSLFNRKGKWCKIVTRSPIDFTPTHWHPFWPRPSQAAIDKQKGETT